MITTPSKSAHDGKIFTFLRLTARTVIPSMAPGATVGATQANELDLRRTHSDDRDDDGRACELIRTAPENTWVPTD
ncbi:hypothetical protein GCM10023191_005370 [Actinoallomurus oryzae]|uniref:Excalibur calcium-binding domain-containing protein n=1 Tax=Actinoallomurus oryzae TaxID=502180 RepID=A0ABP8PBE8_9ACTN